MDSDNCKVGSEIVKDWGLEDDPELIPFKITIDPDLFRNGHVD